MSYSPGQRVTLTFVASTTNVLAALQASKVLPTTGGLFIHIEGYGGSGGGGGGQGGTSAAGGSGGGGSGGCQYTVGGFGFNHNLAHRLDVVIGAGGAGGAGGAVGGGAGVDGGDGSPSYTLDFNDNVILASLAGSSHGSAADGSGNVGRGGATFPGSILPQPSPSEGTGTQPNEGFVAAGGFGGLVNTPGSNGNNNFISFGIPGGGGTTSWTGGVGGAASAGQGGGGGGGGAGPFGSGAAGGAATGGAGGNGAAAPGNSGVGAGGGAGGTGGGAVGGAGGNGSGGFIKLWFIAP